MSQFEKRLPANQLSLRNLFVVSGVFSVCAALGVHVGFATAALAFGMPVIGIVLVDLGGRFKSDSNAADTITAIGSFTIAIWMIAFMIPTWAYILMYVFRWL